MLLSAVSFGLLLAGGDPAQLTKQDTALWESTKGCVAIILRNGAPSAAAALIDKNGLFLASQGAVQGQALQARLSNGKLVTLDWISSDIPTQTALLQAENWKAEDGTVVTLHDNAEKLEKAGVLVVLPSGPVRGELVTGKVGVLANSPSKRAFQLGEVRFEANTESVGGALVFDGSGHLTGLLNATLQSADQQMQRVKVTSKSGSLPPIGPAGVGGGAQSFADPTKSATGPADLTVGYTIGPEVLRRVVTGFLSPNHKVKHPAVGLFCIDAPGHGALVQRVTEDSPAAKAGIEAGDIIIRMDETPIKNQFDFAKVIESKDVGESVTIVVLRDLEAKTFKVTVGTIQKTGIPPTSDSIGGPSG
jgi:S1-C subfamily serine protease